MLNTEQLNKGQLTKLWERYRDIEWETIGLMGYCEYYISENKKSIICEMWVMNRLMEMAKDIMKEMIFAIDTYFGFYDYENANSFLRNLKTPNEKEAALRAYYMIYNVLLYDRHGISPEQCARESAKKILESDVESMKLDVLIFLYFLWETETTIAKQNSFEIPMEKESAIFTHLFIDLIRKLDTVHSGDEHNDR